MPPVMIRRGDTLSQMVNEYNRQHRTNLTVNQVARTNGIRNANRITAGDRITFPDTFERANTRPTSARRSDAPVTTSPTTRSSRNTAATSAPSTTQLRDGGGYGGTQRLAQDAIDYARRMGYSAGSQKRGTLYGRNGRVISGPGSDHHHAQRGAYAVDFPARGARGDALARQLARRYGFQGDGAGSYQGRNIRVGDHTYRVQLLWRVRGHYDHVHLGFRRLN